MISEKLKFILIRRNMNIAKLAEKMGVSGTTLYSKFKRGNFTVKDLEEISKALDLSYDVTFTMNDTQEKF